MEKQMQYAQNGQGPDLITVEEWLQFQDIPFKEMMHKRMGVQRIADATTKFTKGLFDYAALISNGTNPDAAVEMIGENIAANERGQEGPYEIPAMDAIIQAQREQDPRLAQDPSAIAQDPMLAMQQDPMTMLQQSAQMPGMQQGLQVDPEVLAALGNIG